MKKPFNYIFRLIFLCGLMLLITACGSTPVQETPISSPPPVSTSIQNPTSTGMFARGDDFGDGFIARIPIKDVTNVAPEKIVGILVTQWLEHYKTQSKAPDAAIKDYKLGVINLEKDTSYDPFYEIVGWATFSIIPIQTPNQWASFPGESINPEDVWWHIRETFGVFRDGEYFRLRLVSGWGT